MSRRSDLQLFSQLLGYFLLSSIFTLTPVTTVFSAPIGFTFKSVADKSTPVPDGTGNFRRFLIPPKIAGGTVAFDGEGVNFQEGIYTASNGTLAKIADRNTPIPSGVGNFTKLIGANTDGNNVVFLGADSNFQEGIYVSNGTLTTIVDKNTPIPDGTGNFTRLSGLSIDDGTVAFKGGVENGSMGIYTNNGTLNTVADENTAIPNGTGNFNGFFTAPELDGGIVAFGGYGNDFKRGIYTMSNGSLAKAVDTNTLIPGGTGSFTSFFYSLSMGDGTLAFAGLGSGGQVGIYTSSGNLTTLADMNTPVPDGSGKFADFGIFAVDGDTVAFIGVDSLGVDGIYVDRGMGIEKIIDINDLLDGKAAKTVVNRSFYS